MRFIIAHATETTWEEGGTPDAELIARVGDLIGRLSQAGIFERGEGLGPTSRGVRIRFRDGARDVMPGPFTGAHELAASSTVSTHTLDEAMAWATALAGLRRRTGGTSLVVRAQCPTLIAQRRLMRHLLRYCGTVFV